MTAPSSPLERSSGRGVRIGLVLLLVAAVPVIGIGGLALHAVQQARAHEHDATRVGALARDAIALTELDGAVFEEMVWSAVAHLATSIDASPDLALAFLGTDPAAEEAAARTHTDALLTAVDRPVVAAQVRAARDSGLDRRGVVSVFGQATVTIETELGTVLAELTSAPHGESGALPRALEILRLAVDARVSASEQFNAYFATTFDLRDSGPVELRRLIAATTAYESDIASLAAVDGEAPAVAAAAAALRDDGGLHTFASIIDDLISSSLRDGVAETPTELTAEGLQQHFDDFRAAYQAASRSSDAAMDLLDAAETTVLDTARAAERSAHDDIILWYAVSTTLTIATAASALLATRYIVLPLRRLHQAAIDLRTGDSVAAGALAGPAEVRTAALALRDAVTHVDLVARQAHALASGNLDAAVLHEPAPGGLGVALQHAVANLRSAMAQQEEFQRRLVHETSHDALTRLPNRNASLAHLARSLARSGRAGTQLAVLVIDIDRFNEVNDHHGHRGGDTVLATLARRLVTTVRDGDHVGRLGGDEFVIVAESVAGVDEAISLADLVVAAMAEPVLLADGPVRIHASVGIAVADGRLTADELLRDADLAVSRAKETGGGGIEVCNEDLHAQIAATADLQAALRHAIEHDELVVHYQPIVDGRTGDLHALEALVRWQRPGFVGLVPPDRFIGVAERSALIIDLDQWVVRAVARQLAAWTDDPVLGDVPVAVNVSGRHLADQHVVEQLLHPFAAAGVAARRVIVEVTESALVGDLTCAASKLHRLRSAGMRVAIDDFGTGYTSLAHLRCLPVDVLKVDRTFTLNAMTSDQGASIVKLIIDAGHLLGATITAEGIETDAEAARLRALGADHLQGFLFARPMPSDEVERAHGHRHRVAG